MHIPSNNKLLHSYSQFGGFDDNPILLMRIVSSSWRNLLECIMPFCVMGSLRVSLYRSKLDDRYLFCDHRSFIIQAFIHEVYSIICGYLNSLVDIHSDISSLSYSVWKVYLNLCFILMCFGFVIGIWFYSMTILKLNCIVKMANYEEYNYNRVK